MFRDGSKGPPVYWYTPSEPVQEATGRTNCFCLSTPRDPILWFVDSSVVSATRSLPSLSLFVLPPANFCFFFSISTFGFCLFVLSLLSKKHFALACARCAVVRMVKATCLGIGIERSRVPPRFGKEPSLLPPALQSQGGGLSD